MYISRTFVMNHGVKDHVIFGDDNVIFGDDNGNGVVLVFKGDKACQPYLSINRNVKKKDFKYVRDAFFINMS